MDYLQGKVLGAKYYSDTILTQLNAIGNSSHIATTILDILICALIFYWIYILVKETRGIRIIWGIVVLIVLAAIGRLFELSAFNFVLKYLTTMIIVAIPVVLQPELRAALERLGRANIVADIAKLRRRDIESLLNNITETVDILAKNRIGALIVIGRQAGLREYIENGTIINGAVSSELMLTVFTNKTPLHDGAIIIIGNKLVAAGCTLPLTDIKLNINLGTRHRAALGTASQTDALVIVVSEERGEISLAIDAKLYQNITKENLRERLSVELNELRNVAKEQQFIPKES